MYGRLYKNIGFSLMPFAFLFLFEPGYAILDPLPDFIGYFILCAAVINLADVCPNIRDAFCGFRRAAILSLLRFVSIFLLYNFFYDNEQTVGLLIFSFVFSFFEIVTLIPTYKKFFEGLLSLGMHHDGSAIYHKKVRIIKKCDRKSKKTITLEKISQNNITEKTYFFTVFFVIVRALAMTLPEFTTLSSNSYYEFIILLRAFTIIAVLPVSIIWLIKMIRYCSKIRKDTVFINNISSLYINHANESPDFYKVRVIFTGSIGLFTAFLLSIDIYADWINLIPDYIFYALVILSVIFLSKYSKKWYLSAISSLFGIISSVLCQITEKRFIERFDFSAIRRNIDAYYAHYNVLATKILGSVFFIITVISTLVFLWDIYRSHSELNRVENKREYRSLKKNFVSRSLAVLLTSVLSVSGEIYHIISRPYYTFPYYYSPWYYAYSMPISIALSIIFASVVCYFILYIANSVKFRYRMQL